MNAFLVGVIALATMVVAFVAAVAMICLGISMTFSLWSLRIGKFILGTALFFCGLLSFLWLAWETTSCLGEGAKVRWVDEK